MNTAQLLATLTHQGFTLRPLPGEKIEVRPAGRLTSELREALRQKKLEVLALLTSTDRPDQAPTLRGTLKIKTPAPLPDELRQELKQRKAEVLALLTSPSAWPCPHCGRPASVEDVDFSTDGERRLTFWSCAPCQIVAVTPADIKQPPTGWVKRAEQ